ncbi:MAG TPA: carboxypeptidase regulatory-like domain-containing protein [Acidobacteriaceae bacterium]
MKKYLGLLASASVAVSMIAGVQAHAQSAYGIIAGSVTDATGAAVVGATVTATDVNTNVARTVKSGAAGNYRIEGEQQGVYRIEVTAPSFSKTVVNHTEVDASVVTSVNVTLTAGSNGETVEVTSDVAALKTESGELSETLSGTEINALPIANLNPYSLATTLPGVTTVTAGDFTNGTSFSVNGNRPRDNNFLIEGVDNNDQGIHGQAFQPANVEAVAEATFLLDSFSAEYGRGGAVSNIIFQSGSNQFHGAVYERILNSALDATDKGDVLFGNPKVSSRENLFGFRIGGPIFRDRAFFFVSNQWDRLRQTANAGILTVPDAAGYTILNKYASNPRIANLVKAYGGLVGTNANYAASQNLGPDPVCTAANPGNPGACPSRGVVTFAGVQRSIAAPTNSRELEATSDVVLSSADKLRFRFIQSPNSTPFDIFNAPDQLPGFDSDQVGVVYNAGITETHVFSPNLLNELRLSWSRIGFTFDLRPETYANPLALSPAISITGITGYGIPGGIPQGRFQNTYQLQDAVSYTKGRSSLKFGFDLLDMRIKDGIPFNFYGSIAYQGQIGGGYSALGNYLDDYSGAAVVNGSASPSNASITFGNPTARPEIWSQNYYIQDSFKLFPNLEIDAGLRYEYNGTPFNYLGFPALNLSSPATFPLTTKQVAQKNDWGPRVGFNYSPFGAGKTVLSAGFGMFYSHVFTNIIDNIQGSAPNAAAKLIQGSTSGRGNANWSKTLNICPSPQTVPPTPCGITTTAPAATDTANVIAPNLMDPVVYQYNLRVQQELPGSLVAAAEYVGNRSEHEYTTEEWNPLINGGSRRLISNRGRIILQDNQGDSNYNSAQFELQKKQRHGMSLRAVYTYSKALDDGSEIFTDGSGSNGSTYAEIQRTPRSREYANSLFDHRHRVAISGVYQVPTWHADGGMRLAAAIVNGFTFAGITSFQSGQPENVEVGYDWNLDGISNDRPILLTKSAPLTNWAVRGDDFFGLPAGTLCDGPHFWATNDPCQVVSAANTHWVTSPFGTTGNTIARNAFTTDHTSNTDFTVDRTFKTFEHQSFSIRAEALNVFNQGNTGSYNANLISGVPYNGTDLTGAVYTGSVTFGDRALTVTGNRILRFYGRYQF